MSSDSNGPPQLAWVYVSGAAFVATLLAAALYIVSADRLTFIPTPVYYVLLMPIAMAAAAFLFGAMRSHARYRGTAAQGTLQLGGPVVVFSLVLLGGVWISRPSTTNLTVRAYGSEGREQLVTVGEIVLDLGDDRRTGSLGPDGQVTFAQVPVQFLAGEVHIIPRIPGHRARHAGPYRASANGVIELHLERLPDSTRVSGSVVDERGPVSGALINISHGLVTARTDANGDFRVVVPLEPGRIVPLVVTLEGRTLYDDDIVVAPEPGLRIAVPRGVP